MYYETEQEIDKLLQELDINILEIDDSYNPNEEEIIDINEFYDTFEIYE